MIYRRWQKGIALGLKRRGARKSKPKTNQQQAVNYRYKNLQIILALALAAFVSLYLRYRLFPILSYNPAYVLAADNDSASYLRLFDLALTKFPKMPGSIDFYSAYPWGFKQVISPIWPYFLAMFSIPMSVIFRLQPAQAAGLLAIAVGLAAPIPIYFFTKEIFGKQIALISAFISLFLPRFVSLSNTRIDHHVADLLLVSLIFASFLNARRYYIEKKTSDFVILLGVAGMLVAAAMLISLSLILILSMIMVPVIISLFIFSREEVEPVFAVSCGIFGFASLILALLTLTTTWFVKSFDFSHLSYLHIAVFGVIAIISGVGFAAFRTSINLSTIRIIVASALVALIGLAFSISPTSSILVKAYLRSIGSYPLGIETQELSSMFSRGIFIPIAHYSYLFFIAPLAIIYSLLAILHKRAFKFEHLFFYSMFTLLGFYAIEALYYSLYLSIFIVIGYALSIALVARSFRVKINDTKSGNKRVNLMLSVCTLAVILVMAYEDSVLLKPVMTNPNLLDIAQYIRENTPAPGNFYRPEEKPSYGIMCNWDQSFRLQYFSQRATVSTGNHETGIKGVIAAEKFFQALSENEGLKVLEGLNVKYVVIDRLIDFWEGDISRIGEPTIRPIEVARRVDPSEADMNKIRQTMAARLYYDILSPPPIDNRPPLHHFRLLYISDAFYGPEPFIIQEVVKGARIIVKMAPGDTASIETKITANNGYVITWRSTGQADENGIFSTIVPYSTQGGKPFIKVERYRLKSGNIDSFFDVDEDAVQNGETISLSI
ncbi:MAG: hypothetical protein QME63_05530 [Actinomycetota bacterium]|nr:hypothetical protein [Actinomycetota bacterium]